MGEGGIMDNLELYAFAHRGGGGITPTGTIEITDTELTDVSAYANAQVVDANLVAENIKKDVEILGTTGTYEGGGILKIVTWADGTDEEIVAMLQAHYDGLIDIHDYWTIGDERTVSLGAIPSSGSARFFPWSVGESQVAQDVTFVLMHEGLYELSDGTECAFVVGQKEVLQTSGYLDVDSHSSWNGASRDNWCDLGYWSAIPSTLRPIFKMFKMIVASNFHGESLTENDRYFSLFAAKEIFGEECGMAMPIESDALTQIDYYKTTANRIKTKRNSTTNFKWWTRSMSDGNASFYITSNEYGVVNSNMPASSTGCCFAPFGCI